MLGYGDKADKTDRKIIRVKGGKEIKRIKKKKLLSPSSLTCHALML
jgi:hypothetical protein